MAEPAQRNRVAVVRLGAEAWRDLAASRVAVADMGGLRARRVPAGATWQRTQVGQVAGVTLARIALPHDQSVPVMSR